MLIFFLDPGKEFSMQIIQVSPDDLPDGKDPQFRIYTLIGIALQLGSSDSPILDREDRRGNHRAVCLTFYLKNFLS